MYTPGVVTTFVVPVPVPDQVYVTPGVVDDAVNVTLVFAHVNGPSFTTTTFGSAISCVTVVLPTTEQPLGAVTVTVNVPGVVVVKLAALPPTDDHWYVAPTVAVVALTVTLVLLQVNGPSFTTFTLGMLASCVTVVLAVVVQPFAAVTVTVYVPAALVVVTAVAAPFDHK